MGRPGKKAGKVRTETKSKAGEPNKGGRPTLYRAEHVQRVEGLCLLGLTDVELAKCFGVNADTLYEWQKEHPEFREAMLRGKEEADQKVARALYQRALGFSHPATKVFCYEGAIVTAEVTEHHAPEVAACIFWLKNRHPDKWRDKLVDLKLEQTNVNLPEAFMQKVRDYAKGRFAKAKA